MATKKSCYTVHQYGYSYPHGGKCLSLAAARKDLVKLSRESAKNCRRTHGSCTTKGTAKSGAVEITVGGRQGHNLWSAFYIHTSR